MITELKLNQQKLLDINCCLLGTNKCTIYNKQQLILIMSCKKQTTIINNNPVDSILIKNQNYYFT